MKFAIDFDAGTGERRLRLSTLTNIRWLAVLGQLLAIMFVGLVLKFEFPAALCLALVAVAALLNLVLIWNNPSNKRLRPIGVFLILAFDVAQLAALLALTGGMMNPFSILLVVPVVISAATLRPRYTVIVGFVAIGMASLLVYVHRPLPWYPGFDLEIPLVYVQGIWFGVVSCLAFTAFYVYRVAEEARRLSDALAATELVLQREQHMSALDGLAAAAAHELGTPLATIAVVAREMDRQSAGLPDLKEDITLLKTQADRCREILRRLRTLGTSDSGMLSRMTLSTLVEEVAAPHREFGIGISTATIGHAVTEPVGHRNPGVIYGLGNLVENAVDFARETVDITMEWTEDVIRIRIVDDGPGFSFEVLEHLGEPDIPVARSHQRARNDGRLGLGIFIAKTLLERSGATIRFGNAYAAGKGAEVAVEWARTGTANEPGAATSIPRAFA